MKNILVPIDFSKSSEYAAKMAAKILNPIASQEVPQIKDFIPKKLKIQEIKYTTNRVVQTVIITLLTLLVTTINRV